MALFLQGTGIHGGGLTKTTIMALPRCVSAGARAPVAQLAGAAPPLQPQMQLLPLQPRPVATVVVVPDPKPAPPPTPPAGSEQQEIVIHVVDKSTGQLRDFRCDRDVLCQSTTYFRELLAQHEVVDVTVHCNVTIFAWLVQYIHACAPAQRPTLDVKNVITVLISAEYLGIAQLVDECLDVVKQRIGDIAELRINMNTLPTHVQESIAKLFSVEDVECAMAVGTPNFCQFADTLFLHKIPALIAKPGNALHKCKHAGCGNLFTSSQLAWMTCPAALVSVTRAGVLQRHSPDPEWDVNKFIGRAYEACSGTSWRLVYWALWCLTTSAFCARCNSRFPLSSLSHCASHLLAASFAGDSAIGEYMCCGQKALRFGLQLTTDTPNGLTTIVANGNGCHRQPHEANLSALDVDAITELSMLCSLQGAAPESALPLHELLERLPQFAARDALAKIVADTEQPSLAVCLGINLAA
eukprot:TRINITY_DN935_c0_g1_i2.p1 TRINITY_DN935_c0_g1~~TRINITY_DN935_c0_g1_i2.p1  ORF type:complete len:468 (+),score=124.08 TRINITY_DN935_c0_g1_i2:1379-2782(+)